MNNLVIYSQNVSCDKHSQSLPTFKGMGKDYEFKNRILALIKGIPSTPNIDVIAFNEIRYKDNVELVKKLLEEKNFQVFVFFNNKSEMTFNNIIGVSKSCDWQVTKDKHVWVSGTEDSAWLSDEYTKVEGDEHGRCAGVVYLTNKNNSKVCIVSSHVIPFGKVKVIQQNALFSINQENLKEKIPTIIVGDLNRFVEDNDDFQNRLKSNGLVEGTPTETQVPTLRGEQSKQFKDKEDVGTFTPWPTDNMYNELFNKPLSVSRLDVHLLTDDRKLIKSKLIYTRASMLFEGNMDETKIRHILDRKMASDHLAIIGQYQIN